MIAVITPTGDRVKALDRCNYYIKRQTLLPNYWIVSDSGRKPYQPNVDYTNLIYSVKTYDKDKAKDFTGNVLNLISLIPKDVEYIIVMEDDDWYDKSYIETVVHRLQNSELVGQPNAIYYNVYYKCYRINQNDDRASFCETSFRKNIIPLLKFCCEVKRESAFVDSRLWYSKKFKGTKRLFADKRLCIGIKGMPGRKGIGIGHRPPNYTKDNQMSYLEKLIGKEDKEYYAKLFPVGLPKT